MALVVARPELGADDEPEFWLSRPVAERIEAVEVLRRRMFGGGVDATGPRLQRVCESFNAHDVRYLVVGGYALAAHGLPRATGDFDAWVWVGGDNAERVVGALTAFGFGSLGLAVADFDRADSVVQLGYPPYRIDILTTIDGVEFDDAWSRRLSIDVDGLPMEVIGRGDLIRNKVAADRPQDRADVARLTRGDPSD